jgi:ubiquinone/menaquinone biosynthesis C-methylase UbiE
MKILFTRFLTLFFDLLYHSMAWGYDFVAAFVSLGRWNSWVRAVKLFLVGDRILELGYGPGHLQLSLSRTYYSVSGLDESRYMAQQARRLLKKKNFESHSLVQGKAANLPYVGDYFSSVISTFPTPFIYDPLCIAEIYRVLISTGKLVILLAAEQPGHSLPEKLTRLLFKITGEAAPEEYLLPDITEVFADAGFQVDLNWHTLPVGKLLILECYKP